MYEIVEQVSRWLAEERPVMLARVVETAGISSRDRAGAVAYSPGEPMAGNLFAGAADTELSNMFRHIHEPELRWITISEAAAAQAGLSCGGRARLLVQPASHIDWAPLSSHLPVCLVTDLFDTLVGETRSYQLAELPRSGQPDERLAELARLMRHGVSQTCRLSAPEQVVTTLWPVVEVYVVGNGQIAEALAANAELLGWHLTTVDSTAGLHLQSSDSVVVLSHDLEISGQALMAAIKSDCGYIGALGSRHTQTARAGWLTSHGLTPELMGRIHGPAGINIGSRTPAEIALSILAEIVQVRSNSSTRTSTAATTM